jgi:hypothetical protein
VAAGLNAEPERANLAPAAPNFVAIVAADAKFATTAVAAA